MQDFNLEKLFQQCERFDNHKFIQKGAYGLVVSVFDKKLQKRVAIKIFCDILKDYNSIYTNPKVPLKRLFYEIKVLKFLKENPHQNVLDFLDMLIIDKSILIVFNVMDGTLKVVNRTHQINPNKDIIYQIISGLNHLHQHGIKHQDIKPDNILYDKNGIKLCDFGLCVEEDVNYGELVITRWYRPLELFLGYNNSKCECDMWSIGCIVYEIMTNEVLFKSKDYNDHIKHIISKLGFPEEREIFGSYNGIKWLIQNKNAFCMNENCNGIKIHDEILKDFILKCLNYDPSKRIDCKNALKHEMFKGIDKHIPQKKNESKKFKSGFRSYWSCEQIIYHIFKMIN